MDVPFCRRMLYRTSHIGTTWPCLSSRYWSRLGWVCNQWQRGEDIIKYISRSMEQLWIFFSKGVHAGLPGQTKLCGKHVEWRRRQVLWVLPDTEAGILWRPPRYCLSVSHQSIADVQQARGVENSCCTWIRHLHILSCSKWHFWWWSKLLIMQHSRYVFR